MPIEEVKVIGVDEVRTHESVPENLLYNVYFEPSIVPTNDWIRLMGDTLLSKVLQVKLY